MTLVTLVILLVVESLFFALAASGFWLWTNWEEILIQAAIIGIIAVPASVLLISGQFDLSVAAGVALCGVILAQVAQHQSLALGVVLAVLAGGGLGLLNGLLVGGLGLNSLLVTFGTLFVASGLAEAISGFQPLTLAGFDTLGTARPVWHVPLAFLLFLAVAIVLGIMTQLTPYGRALAATGASPEETRLRDPAARFLVGSAFVLTGLGVAFSGLINDSNIGGAEPAASSELVLSVLVAILLAGTRGAAGWAGLLATTVAVLGLSVLNNGLVLLTVSPSIQTVVLGGMLLVSVGNHRLRTWLGGLDRPLG
jgi:ribose transport system permease protein